MAIRAPSCASRKASPRPMPLLLPVTSATQLRSDIHFTGKIHWKNFQYSPAAAEVLPKPRDDYRHVIRLFRSSSPLLRSGHQRFGNHQGRCTLHANRGFLQSANPQFFAIDVFWFNQAITEPISSESDPTVSDPSS